MRKAKDNEDVPKRYYLPGETACPTCGAPFLARRRSAIPPRQRPQVSTYADDSNGNQTHRLALSIVNGQPVTQEFEMGYDAENRVVSVTGVNGTNYSATFVYNGDGQRVKSVINGETILFIGGYFELKGSEVTKVYPGGAIRKYTIPQSMNVEYVLGDHLGSSSIMTDSNGDMVSEMRYSPWGEVRYSWVDPNLSTTPAYTLPKRTFTGQYSYMDDPSTQGVDGFGLMFYNARFYDPQVGRFSQADTIVPGGIQGLDRYAYVGNNPVNGVDPSGHSTEDWQKKPAERHEGCNPQKNRKCVTPIKVVICGYDDPNGYVPCGDGGALDPYAASASTGNVIIVDCGKFDNLPNGKEECADYAEGLISAWQERHPDAKFILIGHSAGADVAILVASWMVNTAGLANNLFALVILDPSLTFMASYGDPDDPSYIEVSLKGVLLSLIQAGVLVVAANSEAQKGTEAADYLASLSGDSYHYLGVYTYAQLGVKETPLNIFDDEKWDAHMALANSFRVCQDVQQALGLIGDFCGRVPNQKR